MWFIVPAGFCFLIALLLTPFVKRLAIRIGAMDKPNERKVHQRLMPRMGGLAIFLSFIAGVFLFIPDWKDTGAILLGGTFIVAIGMLDDIVGLSPKVKFLGQMAAALIPVINGISIEYITLPDGDILRFGLLAIPITIFWIVAITNAINLIDGLDGLAAGVSSIALLTISTLAFSLGNANAGILGLLMFGSTAGFLIHNFYPAKVFMGDTGPFLSGI